jgi:hypothetical protein
VGAIQPFIYARFMRVLPEAPILLGKDAAAPSVFSPRRMLTEARRQKNIRALSVPAVCVLDPDGDIVRWLKRTGRGTLSDTWACYHSELCEFDLAGVRIGIVGCAVGAPYAVLVAEQMFACGCELLMSVTSSGQIAKVSEPPYFVLVTRALRDEGTSYHYQPVGRFAEGDRVLLDAARSALRTAGVDVREGASWTTDTPSVRWRRQWLTPNAEHFGGGDGVGGAVRLRGGSAESGSLFRPCHEHDGPE